MLAFIKLVMNCLLCSLCLLCIVSTVMLKHSLQPAKAKATSTGLLRRIRSAGFCAYQTQTNKYLPTAKGRKLYGNDFPRSLTIRITAFYDDALYGRFSFSKQDTEKFIGTVVKAAELYYQQDNILKIVTFTFNITNTVFYENITNRGHSDIDKLKASLCDSKFAKTEAQKSDIKILFSGRNLWFKPRNSGIETTAVVGVAQPRSMCNSQSNCAVIQATSFLAALTTAHEMGHSLGMDHDGDPGPAQKCAGQNSIMASTTGAMNTKWSLCSKEQLLSFIRLQPLNSGFGNGNCFNETTSDVDTQWNDLNPGLQYDANEQCGYSLGQTFKQSPQLSQFPCSNLVCTNGYLKVKANFPALPGTRCGQQGYACTNEGKCQEEK